MHSPIGSENLPIDQINLNDNEHWPNQLVPEEGFKVPKRVVPWPLRQERKFVVSNERPEEYSWAVHLGTHDGAIFFYNDRAQFAIIPLERFKNEIYGCRLSDLTPGRICKIQTRIHKRDPLPNKHSFVERLVISSIKLTNEYFPSTFVFTPSGKQFLIMEVELNSDCHQTNFVKNRGIAIYQEVSKTGRAKIHQRVHDQWDLFHKFRVAEDEESVKAYIYLQHNPGNVYVASWMIAHIVGGIRAKKKLPRIQPPPVQYEKDWRAYESHDAQSMDRPRFDERQYQHTQHEAADYKDEKMNSKPSSGFAGGFKRPEPQFDQRNQVRNGFYRNQEQGHYPPRAENQRYSENVETRRNWKDGNCTKIENEFTKQTGLENYAFGFSRNRMNRDSSQNEDQYFRNHRQNDYRDPQAEPQRFGGFGHGFHDQRGFGQRDASIDRGYHSPINAPIEPRSSPIHSMSPRGSPPLYDQPSRRFNSQERQFIGIEEVYNSTPPPPYSSPIKETTPSSTSCAEQLAGANNFPLAALAGINLQKMNEFLKINPNGTLIEYFAFLNRNLKIN